MRKTFTIMIAGSVVLEPHQIWPDGDAPQNPTADDVLEALGEDSIGSVLIGWNMEDDFSWEVSDG